MTAATAHHILSRQIDSFEPDYDDTCEACGESPTVVAMRYGRIEARVHLCGPCTWGEAAMINPREWNQ
jgi:hypothetical protein